MGKVALAIWLFLIAYKIYDMKRPQVEEKEEISSRQEMVQQTPAEQTPVFDPNWEGHKYSKNIIPKMQGHFSKAMTTTEKARQKRDAR
ncbi:MAG: hypothetical protein JW774_12865 [Candidatus Aureabacteria bacterium]|nr:hypothetical protein [Candidatus Auribacterota bacterium]